VHRLSDRGAATAGHALINEAVIIGDVRILYRDAEPVPTVPTTTGVVLVGGNFGEWWAYTGGVHSRYPFCGPGPGERPLLRGHLFYAPTLPPLYNLVYTYLLLYNYPQEIQKWCMMSSQEDGCPQ
jgi:hypothetical protein